MNETQDLQKYEQVEAFLSFVRNATSRQDFMSKCSEFDTRYLFCYSDLPKIIVHLKRCKKGQNQLRNYPPKPQKNLATLSRLSLMSIISTI